MAEYHIYVKRKGCQGKGCRRCEDFLPEFFEKHNGDMKFDDRVMDNPGTRRMVLDAIRECPADCLDWGPIEKKEVCDGR